MLHVCVVFLLVHPTVTTVFTNFSLPLPIVYNTTVNEQQGLLYSQPNNNAISFANAAVATPQWFGSEKGKEKDYLFTDRLCQERNHRLDWHALLKPCERRMAFGMSLYSALRTDARNSFVKDVHARRTADYTTFRIETRDVYNKTKTFGGDTWRVFVQGPVYIEPNVYDLNNGDYEVGFFVLDAGSYNVSVVLEGSLCSSYVNPPHEWFRKGDFNGHFQNKWMFKSNRGYPFLISLRMWDKLPTFTVTIEQGETDRIKDNLQKMANWQSLCNQKCNFLSDGFGRYKNNKWVPYVKDKTPAKKKKTHKDGLLWIYGDCYAYHFYQIISNATLCTKMFKKCNNTYNWVYPRWNADSKKDKSIHMKHDYYIDLPWLVNYFEDVLSKPDLNRKSSGMLLNLGLHFIRSTSFRHYRQLIDAYIDVIKKHPTKVVWRSTTSIYRAEPIDHKRFQTNQRALLFNAYSLSAMCKAGLPVIDVFPMTSALPDKPKDGIHYDINLFAPVTKILEQYFSAHRR